MTCVRHKARSSMLSALVLLAFSSPSLLDGTAPSEPSQLRFLDQGKHVEVIRGPGRSIQLHYPDGLVVPAQSTNEAILTYSGKLESAWFEQRGLELVETLSERLGLYRLRSLHPDEDGLLLTMRLQREGLDVFPDLIFAKAFYGAPLPAQLSVNDPRRSGQWYLDRIQIPEAWTYSTGHPDIRVGVVDNGCDMEHPDLRERVGIGVDLVDGDEDASYAPNDRGNEHGTACAGIIAATGNNQEGIAGVCFDCTVNCVRLLAPEGQGTPLSSDVKAFTWQLDQNVAVSSNSWGYISPTPVSAPLKRALEALIRDSRDGRGAVVVFAAGNSDRTLRDDELYHIEGLLTVGAINRNDETTPYTNRGKWVDVVAPLGTLTTDISGPDGASSDDYTNQFGGTSSAAPVVAGVAALLVAAAPDRTALELSQLIVETASPAYYAVPDADGHDELFGFGVVNPVGALLRLQPGPNPDPDPDTDTDTDSDTGSDTDTPPPANDEGCQGAPWDLVSLAAYSLFAWRRRARWSQELS